MQPTNHSKSTNTDDDQIFCSAQKDTDQYDDYHSLGTYTNFKWTVTQLEPLEFVIYYDGGTLFFNNTTVRYLF